MELIEFTKVTLDNKTTYDHNGTYSYYNMCGGGLTKMNISINNGAINLSYISHWMGGEKIDVKLTGQIKHHLSDTYKIVKFNNNCCYVFIFLSQPIPSYDTFGLNDLPYVSNCPKWSRLGDLIMYHDTQLCNDKCNLDILNNRQIVLEKKHNIHYKSSGNYFNMPLIKNGSHFIFSYTNPCIYFPNLETYICKKILNNEKLSILYVDGNDNIYETEPTNPKDFPDKVMIIDNTPDSFGPRHNNDDCEAICYVAKTHDDISNGINKIQQAYRRSKLSTLQSSRNMSNGDDTANDNFTNDNETELKINYWKPEGYSGPIIMNIQDYEWVESIAETLEKYKLKDDTIYEIKIDCCLPDKMFELGYACVLHRLNDKTYRVATTQGKDDCIKYLEKCNSEIVK